MKNFISNVLSFMKRDATSDSEAAIQSILLEAKTHRDLAIMVLQARTECDLLSDLLRTASKQAKIDTLKWVSKYYGHFYSQNWYGRTKDYLKTYIDLRIGDLERGNDE